MCLPIVHGNVEYSILTNRVLEGECAATRPRSLRLRLDGGKGNARRGQESKKMIVCVPISPVYPPRTLSSVYLVWLIASWNLESGRIGEQIAACEERIWQG